MCGDICVICAIKGPGMGTEPAGGGLAGAGLAAGPEAAAGGPAAPVNRDLGLRLGIIPPRAKALGRLGVRALRRSLGLVAVVGGRAWGVAGVLGVVISKKIKNFQIEEQGARSESCASRRQSTVPGRGGGGSPGPGL